MQLLKHAFRGSYGESKWKPEFGSFYEQKAKLAGKEIDLKEHAGKVALVINVASQCGYTDGGYKALVSMYNKYADKGFTVLAFPCGQFMNQELATDEAVCEFASKKYGAKFPLYSKADVNGTNTQPVYAWLKQAFPGDITWNFASKFIIDRNGVPVKRFEKESYADIEKFVVEQLKQEKPAGAAAAVEAEKEKVDEKKEATA